MLPAPPLLLFDGLCHLCDGAVQFIVDHERAPVLQFASLGSEAARAALGVRGVTTAQLPDSMVLVDDDGIWTESEAAVRVARFLRPPWSWLAVAQRVPRGWRDAGYRVIARNRIRWFGRRTTCRLPTAETEGRLLG